MLGDDVDGDGHADVIVVLTDAVDIWLSSSSGFAQAPGSPFRVAGATELATGDLDGDGVADVAVGPWSGSDVTLVRGRTFQTRTVRMCERPIGLAIADLDHDGRGELVAACATENRLLVGSWPAKR